ncbi:hypothetical protein QAD02_003744 [Eretmocerus hayati]|uniref:Uncharacterized protein n=1 Tax=Eretmocerus hayati TaxID=131215 RepID=A0ACC2NMV3_9HYME|nr:hypothetical protein QAD02_003744 [Eretmocerus hayati]
MPCSTRDSKKNEVQSRVIQILETSNYSLNVVNRYKENIVHTSAVNNCIEIMKCILQYHENYCLERKNAFGWTPLMQAIRNENFEMVQFLLERGVAVNDFSFLGMSVLSLSCAISVKMFDLLYHKCPSALEYAAQDDFNPLCVAALKNDKKLFLKLIDLGLNVHKANAFTHTMMKRSTVPEITKLAKSYLSSEDYWNDLSEIQDLLDVGNSADEMCEGSKRYPLVGSRTRLNVPKIRVQHFPTLSTEEVSKHKKDLILNLQLNEGEREPSLISPTLSYANDSSVPVSPNTFIAHEDYLKSFPQLTVSHDGVKDVESDSNRSLEYEKEDRDLSPLVLKRCQDKRPPNLKLRNSSSDSDATLSYTPQFSPCKTPNLPQDISEENVFDETTPTPPKYKTPPRGIIQDPGLNRLVILLQRFGLKRHIPTFVEQEVDLDLFFTLSDKDLMEIGIENKSERLILLSVISECKSANVCS